MKHIPSCFKPLKYKDLITFFTLLLGLAIGCVLWAEWQNEQQAYQAIQQKLCHTLQTHLRLLTQPVQQREHQYVQSILNALSSDPDVIGAIVTDSRGAVLGQIGPQARHATGPRHTAQATVDIDNQDGKAVGTLTVTLNTRHIYTGALLRLGLHTLLVSCTLLTVATLVSRRHRRCRDAARQRLFSALPPHSLVLQGDVEHQKHEDVLDIAIVALGEMQRHLDHMQSNLQETNDTMAHRLQEQTQVLDQTKAAAAAAQRETADRLLTKAQAIHGLTNGIISRTDTLIDTQLMPAQQTCVRAVQNAAQALVAIRRDLYELARGEAPPLAFASIPFDLHDMLESSLSLLAEPAQAKGLILLSCIHPHVPRQVSGDPARLRQLLLNLLANAIEFTHAGTVALSADRVNADDAVVTLRFEVHDTGIGLDPDILHSPLDHVSPCATDADRASVGPGLGLPVCKQLAAAMHGTIGAQRTPPMGSMCWATIQLGYIESDDGINPYPSDLLNSRVLIVDALELNRNICQRQLTTQGLQVMTAASTEAALSQLAAADEQGQPFAFAIIRHQPPTCDGWHLGQQLGPIHTPDRTKCVLVTTPAQARSISYLAEKLFDTTVHTPLYTSTLLDCLAKMMGSHQVDPSDVEPAVASPETPRSLRILLAEDNYVNQRVAFKLLNAWGHKVDIAANGLEALEAIRQHTYDLVLMDVQMPEMDGVEATRQIRQLKGASAHIPIVAMTANAMQGDRERFLEAGMNDYLAKPIARDRLLAILQRYACGRQGLDPETDAPSVQVGTPTPLLGYDVLGYLLNELSRDTVMELTEDYISHSKTLLSQALTAKEAGDMEAVEYAVHTLKGMSGTLGALRLAQTCQEILEACHNQQVQHVNSQLNDLPDMAQATQRALEEWRRQS
jgi:CheY-like chemotaxis protein/HPt (histidine-containing phosphotransfer) domain-containing protein